MPTIILTTTDFETGEYQIAQTAEDTLLLQSYITKHEASFIKRILGKELGELFITNVALTPGRYATIKEAFIEQPSQNCFFESKGMKAVLMGLIYCLYVSENHTRHTQSGVTIAQSEVSTTLSPENAAIKGEGAWNDAVSSIRAIQWYCADSVPATYPEYSGTWFRVKYSPLL